MARCSRETRSSRVIRFIEQYCLIPEGAHVGKPLRLDDFQKKYIRDVYGNPVGTRRAILSMGRKNGKTGLIAALVLVHLIGPEAKLNSQIVSGALSRDQASQVYNYAAKMIQLSPVLSGLVRIIPSSKRLVGLPMNVEYRALAAEGKTAHGLSPVLAILDETGQIEGPNDAFVDAIVTSQGAHAAPLLMVISTQAANDTDLLSVWIDDAQNSKDPRIVCHLYSADAECDLLDEKQWRKANPAIGTFRNMDDIAEQAKQAARMPSAENTFRNLCLNQRVSVFAPFISRNVWQSCGGAGIPFGRAPVYAGLDLSGRADLTAFVMVARVGGVWQIEPHFWTPEQGLSERSKRDRQPYDVWVRQGYIHTTPGATVDYEYVAQHIVELCAARDVKSIAFDRWRIVQIQKELDRIGATLPLIEHGQGFKDMSPAVDTLEAELLNERIAHGNHPVLTMCAANAVITKDAAGNRKLDKRRATGRIDGIVALAMAMHAATQHTEQNVASELIWL